MSPTGESDIPDMIVCNACGEASSDPKVGHDVEVCPFATMSVIFKETRDIIIDPNTLRRVYLAIIDLDMALNAIQADRDVEEEEKSNDE